MKDEIISVDPNIFSIYFSALLDMSNKLVSGSESGDNLIKELKAAINAFGLKNPNFSEYVFEDSLSQEHIQVKIGALESLGFGFIGMTLLTQAEEQEHPLRIEFSNIFNRFSQELSREFEGILREIDKEKTVKNRISKYSDIDLN